jgi:hypothetical protein
MSVDDKGLDNQDGTFDLLVHEKKISDIYQNSKAHQAEKPNAQLDSEIMAIAKQQLLGSYSLLAKDQTLLQQISADKNRQNKTQTKTQNNSPKSWLGPFSLAASVGVLGILFITQTDYFINPNYIVTGDAQIIDAPAMRAPNIIEAEILTPESAAAQPFQSIKKPTSAQKYEVLLDEESFNKESFNKELMAMQRERVSVSPDQKVLKKQMMNMSKLADNAVKKLPMSLSDMSKLAELLRLEQALQNMSERVTSASNVKMQQNLFEQLSQYQKSHEEFELTEKYLSVLTDKQVQQLKSVATEAPSEN